ncbi:MAG: TatD family hydrolase, partial [Oscillibacter sp.]|nr:TatD family hydrolase [Oscillibacter sp.]
LFAAQLRLAARLGLPCSIHSRDAAEDTVAVLRENLSPDLVRDARAGRSSGNAPDKKSRKAKRALAFFHRMGYNVPDCENGSPFSRAGSAARQLITL